MTRKQLALDVSSSEGTMGIASAQVVVRSATEKPLLVSQVLILFLHTLQRKGGDPFAGMKSVLPVQVAHRAL